MTHDALIADLKGLHTAELPKSWGGEPVALRLLKSKYENSSTAQNTISWTSIILETASTLQLSSCKALRGNPHSGDRAAFKVKASQSTACCDVLRASMVWGQHGHGWSRWIDWTKIFWGTLHWSSFHLLHQIYCLLRCEGWEPVT